MFSKTMLSSMDLLLLPFAFIGASLLHAWALLLLLVPAIFLYIQKRKHLETIEQLQNKLYQRDALLHELRTPITTISIATSQLKRQHKPETNLERVEKAAKKLEKIISNQCSYETINFGHLLQEIQEIVAPKLESNQIDLQIKPELCSQIIYAKKLPLEQVLINLISNSCDAIKNNSERWIELNFEERSEMIILSVTDSGTGVPKKYRHKIMNSYFTTKQKTGGKGLGLSICRQIINDHNGSLKLNTKSRNTQFVISLPKLVA